MCYEDTINTETYLGNHHLPLRPLTTIKQKPVFAELDKNGRRVSINTRNCARSSEKGDFKKH